MKKLLFVIILIVIANSFIVRGGYENYTSLKLKLKIEGNLSLKSTTGEPYSVGVNLSIFPREDYRQFVLSQKTFSNPEGKVEKGKNYFYFQWENPKKFQFIFGVESNIMTTNEFVKVKEKINFPLKKIPSELEIFTKPGEYITIDDGIKKKATELAEGEDDLYRIVIKIAKWVKENVKYDLLTMTAKSVKNSSWVFKSRRGVCDEITNLYISMLRSLGIPSRFVYGQAYTNLQKRFGNHAWAEVYFPGYGWIPVDVTYGQFGWIDVTHIKLKTGLDSGEPSAEYNWKGFGVNIEESKLNIDVNITEKKFALKDNIDFSIVPLVDMVGPGSFVPIIAKIKNKNPYYVPLTISLSKAPEVVGKISEAVVVEPNSEESVIFVVKIKKDLKEGYWYTAKIEAKTNLGNVATSEIRFSKEYEIYTKNDTEAEIKNLMEKREKKMNPLIKIFCSHERNYYYANETISLNCEISNEGNKNLKNVKLCIGKVCKEIGELRIASRKKATLEFIPKKYLKRKIVVSAEAEDFFAYKTLNITIVKFPNLKITNLEPKELDYKKEQNVSFEIEIDSPINNLVIQIGNVGKVAIEKMENGKIINVPILGKDFFRGKIKFVADYEDLTGRKYRMEKTFKVKIKNLPWYIRFLLWIESLF